MTYDNRIGVARKQLYSYRWDKIVIEEYIESCSRQARKMGDDAIRGTFKSDPTARGGIMLAEPPERIARRVEWVKAIEDAWAELHLEDQAYRRVPHRGKAYVMENYFCLTQLPRRKERNDAARDKLCEECKISIRTFYNWLSDITACVIAQATRRGLL